MRSVEVYTHGPYFYGWKDIAPHACGIYFLLHDGLIQYIGRSQDILRRLRCHCYSSQIRSGELQVEYYLVDFEESVRLEREWITMVQPPLNTHLYLQR